MKTNLMSKIKCRKKNLFQLLEDKNNENILFNYIKQLSNK